MASFKIRPLPLHGLSVIERSMNNDNRGSFERLFCIEDLKKAGWNKPVSQINRSVTKNRGTVRGLHFQFPPYSETKFVLCTRGIIWDVAVDLRKDSPTFLCWHAEYLSTENQCALLIPEGFAHGFQSITDDVELIYIHSECFNSKAEGRLSFSDKKLNIEWPLPVTFASSRDMSEAPCASLFEGLVL